MKMELRTTSDGHTIVPITRGHLVIPVTTNKYKIIDTITIELTKKDLKPIKHLINNLNSNTDGKPRKGASSVMFHTIATMVLSTELPDILYKKIKKEFGDYFERCDMFKIDRIDLYDIKDSKIVVHLDCLEELRHISVK